MSHKLRHKRSTITYLFLKKNNPKQIKAELCKKEIEEKFGFGKKKTKGK